MSSQKPLIIQPDHMLLLEVEHSQYADCRDFLAPFAQLVKSPEFIHTYRLTPLSLWNTAAVGLTLAEITAGLLRYSKYTIPATVTTAITEWYNTYGKLILHKHTESRLRLEVTDRTS